MYGWKAEEIIGKNSSVLDMKHEGYTRQQVRGIIREKGFFQGEVVVRRKLRRSQLVAFFARQPACLVGMEACATAHYWAREIQRHGHKVRLSAVGYQNSFSVVHHPLIAAIVLKFTQGHRFNVTHYE